MGSVRCLSVLHLAHGAAVWCSTLGAGPGLCRSPALPCPALPCPVLALKWMPLHHGPLASTPAQCVIDVDLNSLQFGLDAPFFQLLVDQRDRPTGPLPTLVAQVSTGTCDG